MKIMLDPGHGNNANRGFLRIPHFAHCNEGSCNWYFSCLLKNALEKNGHTVGLTRTADTDPTLKQRGNSAKGYDLLISVHSNAGGGSGVEVYDSCNPKEKIPDLCGAICKTVSNTLGIPNRGVKYRSASNGTNYYGILRNGLAKHNIILETCFHDNYNDVTKYVNNLDLLAVNIADTIGNVKDTTEDFIKKIAPIVCKYANNIYPSVTLAQAILESNRGQSELATKANNLFGIKAKDWRGEKYRVTTKEQKPNGEVYTVVADFRKYATWEESVKDHDNFFTSTEWRKKYYYSVINATDPIQQCNNLIGTYATDTIYNKKLISLINKYNLRRFDDMGTPSEWAKDSWKECKELGLLDGTRPHDKITREEVAVLIVRLKNLLDAK